MTSDIQESWPLLAACGFAGLSTTIGVWWLVATFRAAGSRYRQRFEQAVSEQLGRSHLFIDPERLMTANVLVAIAGTMGAWMISGSALIAIAVAGVFGLLPRLTLARLRSIRRTRFRRQLPDLMLLTAAGLRSGGSLWQTLSRAANDLPQPTRQEVVLMLREQRLGVSFPQALANLEKRMPVEEMLLMTAALRIAHDTGGNLAEALESLAETARRKLSLESKIQALTAQGRMQGWVMGLLPLLLGAVLFQIEPHGMSMLFETSWGLVVCGVIVVLEGLGVHFVRRIVAVDI